jgi:hypothetical protein
MEEPVKPALGEITPLGQVAYNLTQAKDQLRSSALILDSLVNPDDPEYKQNEYKTMRNLVENLSFEITNMLRVFKSKKEVEKKEGED